MSKKHDEDAHEVDPPKGKGPRPEHTDMQAEEPSHPGQVLDPAGGPPAPEGQYHGLSPEQADKIEAARGDKEPSPPPEPPPPPDYSVPDPELAVYSGYADPDAERRRALAPQQDAPPDQDEASRRKQAEADENDRRKR